MTDPDEDAVGPAFFEQMVEAVGVGVAIYDDTGIYRYVNDAYASLLGTDREQLQGTPLWDVVVGFEADRFGAYWDSFEEGETRVREVEHEWAGRTVDVSAATTRRHIDGTPYHFGTVRDISDQLKREAELREKNERLEAFTGIVSHDLRNPLGVAKGYLDLAREEHGSEELDLVANALDRMEMLVEDLLTLAREGESVAETERVAVETVAEAAWRQVRTAGASLSVEPVGEIEADAARLQQLFENLFRNSVEHGSTGHRTSSGDSVEHGSTDSRRSASVKRGSVERPTESTGTADSQRRVTVTVGPLSDGSGFFVADDGPGFEVSSGEIFEAGYTDSENGTGFGLTIVREIVDGHGWTVTAGESEDGGARFEIRETDTTAE